MAIGKGWSGLFAEQNTLDDVRAKIGQEREGRINKAFQETVAAGGNLNAARVARANQQLAEAVRGGVQNIFGSSEEGAFIPTDPRLTQAVKKDKDRQEIIGILGTYTDPKSPGGSIISEEEMKQGFSELMKRGYVKEAQDFLTMSQSMGGQRRSDKQVDIQQQEVNIAEKRYGLDLKGQTFDQALKTEQFDLDKFLGKANLRLANKKYDHTVLSDEIKRDLARDQFEFQKKMDYKSNSRQDLLAGLQKRSQEFGMKMDLRIADFSEEKFRIQEARLQKHMEMDKYFKEKNLEERQQDREINTILKREGYDIDKLGIEERREQFAEKLAQDKMLGLKGINLDEQKLKLQKDISVDDKRLKEANLNLKKMEIKDLKAYRLASLKIKKEENEIAKTIAEIKAKTPTPTVVKTVGPDEINEMSSLLTSNQDPKIQQQLREKLGIGRYASNNDLVNAATQYQAFIAKNKGRGLTDWVNSLVGQTENKSDKNKDDLTSQLKPKKKDQ